MTDPQGSVPIIEPGNPHPRLHFNIQSAAVLCFSAQAGPASPLGRRPKINAKNTKRAMREKSVEVNEGGGKAKVR